MNEEQYGDMVGGADDYVVQLTSLQVHGTWDQTGRMVGRECELDITLVGGPPFPAPGRYRLVPVEDEGSEIQMAGWHEEWCNVFKNKGRCSCAEIGAD